MFLQIGPLWAPEMAVSATHAEATPFAFAPANVYMCFHVKVPAKNAPMFRSGNPIGFGAPSNALFGFIADT